jgi:hypothetical protein
VASIEVGLDIVCSFMIIFMHVVSSVLCSSRDSQSQALLVEVNNPRIMRSV